jgi:hypothetical protein
MTILRSPNPELVVAGDDGWGKAARGTTENNDWCRWWWWLPELDSLDQGDADDYGWEIVTWGKLKNGNWCAGLWINDDLGHSGTLTRYGRPENHMPYNGLGRWLTELAWNLVNRVMESNWLNPNPMKCWYCMCEACHAFACETNLQEKLSRVWDTSIGWGPRDEAEAEVTNLTLTSRMDMFQKKKRKNLQEKLSKRASIGNNRKFRKVACAGVGRIETAQIHRFGAEKSILAVVSPRTYMVAVRGGLLVSGLPQIDRSMPWKLTWFWF